MKKLLEQDDCCPDSMQTFEEQFYTIVNKSITEFKMGAETKHTESDLVYENSGFKLEVSADDPYYKLYLL